MYHSIHRLIAFVALLGAAAIASAQTSATSIQSVSAPAGVFARNNTVTFSVAFTGNISVSGTPGLRMTVGGVARMAVFSGFSSFTDVALFKFTADLGDNGSVVLLSPLDLRGGSITGANGLSASLNFTPPDTSQTIIDTTPPTKPVITSYDSTSSTPSFRGTADPGAVVRIAGPFTSSAGPMATAAADGTWTAPWPGAPLNPGSYTYSAWVTDEYGNSNYSDFVTVTVAPTGVPVVEPHADMDLTWQFFRHDRPEIVHIGASNAPMRFEATGLPPGVDFYSRGAPTTPPYAEFMWTYGSLTGGTYIVTVTATNSVGTSAPMTFRWTIHPGMNDFTRTDKRSYVTGETITFTTTFSAPVVVTGTPYIALWGTKRAMYVGGSGTPTLRFTYQVAPDDSSVSGAYYSDIAAGEGSITTVDGVSADLENSFAGLGDYPRFSVTASTPPTPDPTPVVTDASIVGQVGTPLTPVQLQATNSPTSFTAASSLSNYGLTLSSTGLLSGTPTQPASGVAISFTAGNTAGQSNPGTITLNIEAAPPPPPPTPSKADQTITFSSPAGSIIVGQPIQLGAVSSAGLPITYSVISGDATVNGNVLTPTSTARLVVRASSAGSDTINPASTDVTFGNPQKAAQTIQLATAGATVTADQPVNLSATATSGLPVTYSVVSGPATVSGNRLTFTGTGVVVVRASQSGNGSYAAAPEAMLTFTANPLDRLVNLSTRLRVGSSAQDAAIAGFVVTGSAPKGFLIRAVGPGLRVYGVSNPVPTMQLQLVDNSGQVRGTNTGWNNDAQITSAGDAVGAFRLAADSKDAALLANLQPGAYTALVTGGSPGEVLIEVYDTSASAAVPTKQLINISTRGLVSGENPMIGGFVVNGAQPKRLLVRAVGPGLEPLGVSDVLRDPVVKLYNVGGTLLAQNDDWEAPQSVTGMAAPATAAQVIEANTATGAFALRSGAKDAALVLTLPPGAYTAVVTGANGTSGSALVEVYDITY